MPPRNRCAREIIGAAYWNNGLHRRVGAIMLALSSRAALLPALGLCSCAVASSRAPLDPGAPDPGLESAVPNWIEDDSPVAVPTVFEAAVQSGRTALARGEYAAARESLTAALAFEESAAMV